MFGCYLESGALQFRLGAILENKTTWKEEKEVGMMDKMMEFMMGRMSKEEKQEMMGKMTEKFFADMRMDDKKKMKSGVDWAFDEIEECWKEENDGVFWLTVWSPLSSAAENYI